MSEPVDSEDTSDCMIAVTTSYVNADGKWCVETDYMFAPHPSASAKRRAQFDSHLSMLLAARPGPYVIRRCDKGTDDTSQRYENLTEEGKREREALVELLMREVSSTEDVPPDDEASTIPCANEAEGVPPIDAVCTIRRANEVANLASKRTTDPGVNP